MAFVAQVLRGSDTPISLPGPVTAKLREMAM